MRDLLDSLFGALKWYRKRRGGKWYKFLMIGSEAGMAGPIEYWSQTPPHNLNDIEVLKEENYDKPNK